MTDLALTLTAISAGAVFMGANTYIGNAPNFMVYAIAREQGVKMPSFFGYMLWSGGVLIPVSIPECRCQLIFPPELLEPPSADHLGVGPQTGIACI
jgi:di/tricarboxylate transporter